MIACCIDRCGWLSVVNASLTFGLIATSKGMDDKSGFMLNLETSHFWGSLSIETPVVYCNPRSLVLVTEEEEYSSGLQSLQFLAYGFSEG